MVWFRNLRIVTWYQSLYSCVAKQKRRWIKYMSRIDFSSAKFESSKNYSSALLSAEDWNSNMRLIMGPIEEVLLKWVYFKRAKSILKILPDLWAGSMLLRRFRFFPWGTASLWSFMGNKLVRHQSLEIIEKIPSFSTAHLHMSWPV